MASPLHKAVLGIGTNRTEKPRVIITAIIESLGKQGRVISRSSIYTTRPYGKEDPDLPWYTNAVVGIMTDLTFDDFESCLKSIEEGMGRSRKTDNSDVAADIDIVIWDGETIRPQEIDRDYFAIGYKELLECR